MPRNSSGTYTLPAGNPVVTGTLIESTWANPTMSDLGSSITDSLDRFGRGGMLAPMRFVDGTVTAPAMAFSSETTLGLYRPSSGTLSVAIGGVARMIMTAALFTINPPTTFAGAVTFSGGATLTGPITVDKLYSNASAQSFTTSVTTTPDWQMAGASAAASFMGFSRFAASTGGPALYLGHSRASTVNTQTIIQNGDQFAQISFFGSDGTAFREGARIVGESDGTPGVADMPGRLRFLVTPDGGTTPVEALRISQTGAALFAASVSVTGAIVALAEATVATTLNVAGATTLQSTAVIGSNVAIPSNTRVLIDRLSTSPLPALQSGTVLTLAGSTSASSPSHLQFIAGNTGSSSVFFGDTDAASRGAVSYNHATDVMSFNTSGAVAVTISAAGDLLPSNAFGLPSGSAASPSLYFTSSPTSGFYRAGADIIGVTNAGVASWRFDASGRYVGGGGSAVTTRVAGTNLVPNFQNAGTSISSASAGLFNFEPTSATSTPYLAFARSRGAALGTNTIVQANDVVGRITAAGADGTQYTEAARISFVVDGTPGASDMPGRIEFATTPDGSVTPTTALTIASDQSSTFAGAIVGASTLTMTTAAGPPQILVNRTSSSVNSEIAFQTSSGTVFIGQGSGNTFAVGGGGGLNVASWFNITSALATFNVNTSIVGTLIGSSTARFGGAAQGQLGVIEGTGSGATANSGADTCVLDSSGSAGISILSPNTTTCNVFFGDPESGAAGRVAYNHTNDQMNIGAGGASSVLLLTSSTITAGSGVELIIDPVGPTSTLSGGFRGVPQNSKSAAYTLVLGDAGKHIYHPSADTTARTWTIPANSSVAFPIGTAVTFVNDNAAGNITIAITTDTLVMAGTGSTGSRTLADNGVATAVKVTATRWVISGTNLT